MMVSFPSFVARPRKCIKLYLTIALSVVALSAATANTVPDSIEYQALKDLFISTNGSQWTNKTNWPTVWPASATAAEFGTWHGVHVQNGDIVAVRLDGNNLDGELPASIFNLTQLKDLYLYGNKISGSIPTSLSNAVSLQVLHLSINKITGSIPQAIGDLSNLQRLHLGNNQLTGPIPDEIGNLIALTEVSVDANGLTGSLPETIGNLVNLKVARFENNKLSGSIPQGFGNLGELVEFYAYQNQLTGNIPSTIGNAIKLQTLHLANNDLSGTIPSSIANLSSLRWLSLGGNNLSGSLPIELGNLQSLETLSLDANKLTGGIPPELGNLTSLKSFQLDNNLLSGPIPQEIGNLSNLVEFRAYNNNLSGSIPPGISNAQSLRTLHLANNQLTGSIPPEIGLMVMLEWLTLDGNQISGTIPPEIGNLINLDNFSAGDNQLSGEIPAEIGNLAKLRVIRLENNQLSGGLPPSIGNLSKLSELFLYNNALSGPLPASIGNASSLRVLHVAHNEMSGEIPSSIRNLAQLDWVALDGNNFSGPLPAAMGTLVSLRQFTASSNQLNGSIPEELSNLSNLEYLGLENNFLSGQLPASFGDLKKLKTLSLRNNQLSGTVPEQIGLATALTTLLLSENQFTGGIPQSIASLPNLTWATFDSNEFTSFPSFLNSPAKSSLTISISNNFISFESLEPNFTSAGVHVFQAFTYSPQKPINDFSEVALSTTDALQIDARPKGQFSTVVWEQLNGTTWTNVTSINADASGQTFSDEEGLDDIGKVYRWRMTNSRVPNIELQSVPITVVEASLNLTLVQWIDKIGVTESDGVLGKIGGHTGIAGATSSNLLKGEQDGIIDFTMADNVSSFQLGFSSNTTSALGKEVITYGLAFVPNQPIKLITNGTDTETTITYSVGDHFVLERRGNQIILFQNDQQISAIDTDNTLELGIKTMLESGSLPPISTNLSLHLRLTATITGTNSLGQNGGVSVTVSTGTAPYNFLWSGGETHHALVNRNLGFYSVTVTDATNNSTNTTYGIGHLISWANLRYATNANGKLNLSSSTAEPWTGGADSYNVLDANSNGWIEFIPDNSVSEYLFGFSTKNGVISEGSVEAGIMIQPGKKITTFIDGSRGDEISHWQPGDVLRLSREASNLLIFRNGIQIASIQVDNTKSSRVIGIVNKGSAPIVVASFNSPLLVSVNITPVKSFGLTGGIDLVFANGQSPFQQIWSTGENQTKISNKPFGSYSVVVTDGGGRTFSRSYDIGYELFWTDLVNATLTDGPLKKTSPPGVDAGANSLNTLKPNEDGWVEYVIEPGANQFSFGLATPSNIFNRAAIDYSFQIGEDGLFITESDWSGTGYGIWSVGDVLKISRIGDEIIYLRNGVELKRTSTDPTKELNVKVVLQSGQVKLMQFSRPVEEFVPTPLNPETFEYKIPALIKVTREGKLPPEPKGTMHALNTFGEGDARQVFVGCDGGQYIVGFQLDYKLDDRNSSINWSSLVQVTLFHEEDVLYTAPLKLSMETQTFTATAFYDQVIKCDGEYYVHFDYKELYDLVPEENIQFKILLYKQSLMPFGYNNPLNTFCSTESVPERVTRLSWNPAIVLSNVAHYDVEWVFVDAHDLVQPKVNDGCSDSEAQCAFKLKEPARVSVENTSYDHTRYYPTGKVYYRVRAVGTDPAYPYHLIPGVWNYFNCPNNIVTNHAPQYTWQNQVVFAEEGKSKKVMRYFDATLRERQVQTNLSTDELTLVGETKYDFEGRASVQVLPIPVAGRSLSFKNGFNLFEGQTDVNGNVSASSKGFYDNSSEQNAKLDETKWGAAQYYSANNELSGVHREYIPASEGYPYSQVEYLNDGTGRVKEQSGVGEVFNIDGTRTIKNFYGEAAPVELVRLFGRNITDASHFKKNLVVDANGQGSVSYLDQEGRVVATALAGEAPGNVKPLPSLLEIPSDLLTVDISSKNRKEGSISRLSHKIVNASPGQFTFIYNLSALSEQLETFGCATCSYDLEISLSDPDGKPVDIAPGDPNRNEIVMNGITAADCSSAARAISFIATLAVGDHTLTKTVKAHEMSYEQLTTIVQQDITIQSQIQSLEQVYQADPAYCDICFDAADCPEEAANLIEKTIQEVAEQECDNILRQIVSDLKEEAKLRWEAEHPGEDYEQPDEPSETQIRQHKNYCAYELCTKDKPSDVFEKSLVLVENWEQALSKNYENLVDADPFFNVSALSGSQKKGVMQTALNAIHLGGVNGTLYTGPITNIVNPDFAAVKVNSLGALDPVGGHHILYYELQKSLAEATITQAEYNAKVSEQRWLLYRSFYLEEKRKIKLTVYAGCELALQNLRKMDGYPTTLEEVDDWVKDQEIDGEDLELDAVTEQDLDVALNRIHFQCGGVQLTATEIDDIRSHFRAYFGSKPQNFYRIIYADDFANGNEHLAAIESILNQYECSLSGIVGEDPLTCLDEETIPGAPSNPGPLQPSPYPENPLGERELAPKTEMKTFKTSISEFTSCVQSRTITWNPFPYLSLGTSTSPITPAEERAQMDALKEFYLATGGRSAWRHEEGWDDAEENGWEDAEIKGTWTGLQVQNGWVISINLSSNGLRGKVPESFGALKFLKWLDLSSNQITELHSSINEHVHLQMINVEGNRSLQAVPDGLSQLHSMRCLNLSLCGLEELPSDFGRNFNQLVVLDLSANPFSNNSSFQLPDFFRGDLGANQGTKSLISLSLSYCQLKALPTHFGNDLVQLKILDLRNNELAGLTEYFHGRTGTGEPNKGMPNLEVLYLGNNKLSALKPDFGSHWSNLVDLQMNNNLLGSLSDHFNGTPQSMPKLQTLGLRDNKLTGLPTNFGYKWTTLKYLDLSRNSLNTLSHYFRGERLPDDAMEGMECLDLRFNQIGGNLPESFGENWMSLKKLRLEGNGLSKLSQYFRGNVNGHGMDNLEELTLGVSAVPWQISYQHPDRFAFNRAEHYQGLNAIKTLPDNFGQAMEKLQVLYMEIGTLEALPDNFTYSNMPNLKVLSVANNSLTELPEHFGQGLKNLEELYLHANNLEELSRYFRGNHLTEGDGMNNLKKLWLGNNLNRGAQALSNPYRIVPSLGHDNIRHNQLETLPENFGLNWSQLEELHLEGNALSQLNENFHGGANGMPKLTHLFLHKNKLNSLNQLQANFSSLKFLTVYANELEDFDFAKFSSLQQLLYLDISENKIESDLTNLWSYPNLKCLDISNNSIRGPIPSNVPSTLLELRLRGNHFSFSDLAPVVQNYPLTTPVNGLYFFPQKRVDEERRIVASPGQTITLSTSIDAANLPVGSQPSQYKWYKRRPGSLPTALNADFAESNREITVPVTDADKESIFYYEIKNPTNFGLGKNLGSFLLKSYAQHLTFPSTTEDITICREFDLENPHLQDFGVVIDWQLVIQQCMEQQQEQKEVLKSAFKDRLIEGYVSDYFRKAQTKCLQALTETLTYTYQNKEHHYTLYYYDQAGNLVQTVPPKGVQPLTGSRLASALEGAPEYPAHTLVTRYHYNSLNQLIWQKTPDAGESQFWYNDVGQIRLSQNAQQKKDNRFSYTKYDEQSRIREVGELIAALDVSALKDELNGLGFPEAASYQLTDVTKTHYDLPAATTGDFVQSNLRSRVSYTEAFDQSGQNAVRTYYSYDPHGNVKALVQEVPGLDRKRTDYVYDLVSGKVNFVMYEYDGADEFIHRYHYDADNRITEVLTSSDGFIWDTDATYSYYDHGPLARTVLGHFKVQGLDYVYTLQGWIKGVNGVHDPGNDGGTGSMMPKDEFSYTLGYYQGDYHGIATGILDEAFHLPGPVYASLTGNTGLYNGNIAWMSTDLKKIGDMKNDRNKGMQAMLYSYDQLHRIRESRSLTNYAASTGFETRTSSPAAYDEDYTYDPNGNLLKLVRRDASANVKDDFTYGYYTHTNKLRDLIPVERDATYTGQLISDSKVYDKITIQNGSYVASGTDVQLKASGSIDIDATFDVQDNAVFDAYVLDDEEGMYLYDAIGNLVWDQEEGVRITWTPYGKVREVIKENSQTVSFRYDAAGNRVEKKVTASESTSVTRYLRDASGNVLAVYKNEELHEQTIYGSTRLGLHRPGRKTGHRALGSRSFELSNHLGNVLVVVTDHAQFEAQTAETKVVTVNDYYPFGLNMEGREFSDEAYRYGFNGEEKDDNGEFGSTVYDYGFRIYNPSIGKFLSVDPLTASYPWYTPYQFAGNKPIRFIDLDGLEEASHGNNADEKPTRSILEIGLKMAENPMYGVNHAYISLNGVNPYRNNGKLEVGEEMSPGTLQYIYGANKVTWCNQFSYDLTKSLGYGNPWKGKILNNQGKEVPVSGRVNANTMNEIMNYNSEENFIEVPMNLAYEYVNQGGLVYFSYHSGSSKSGHIATGVPTKDLQEREIDGVSYKFGDVVQAGSKVGDFPLFGAGGVYSDKLAPKIQAFILIESLPGLKRRLNYTPPKQEQSSTISTAPLTNVKVEPLKF